MRLSDAGVSSRPPDEPAHELIELLRMLSPNQRGALVLRDLYGYPSAEAGRILGISEVAVRVHLHAARRRLRGLLEEVERA
jgi:RNA polymerase sigma-70 factor (ECF subfamily)